MKKILTALSVLLLVCALAFSVSAESQFEIAGSELCGYTGTDSVVYIPTEVTNIKAGAFDSATELKTVIFNSFSCTFDTGAIPAGVTVKAPESSDAHLAALRDGLSFMVLDGSIDITVNYVYASGDVALPSFTEELYSGDSYSYDVPVIEGYTPNINKIEGIAGDNDITVTVIYRSSLNDGWVIKDGRAKYVYNGSYLADTTHEIDGLAYNFDENGYLMIAAGFLNTPAGSYYFSNNVTVTGYHVIGKSIYYFNEDGTMLKGDTLGGNEFDIGGNLMGSDVIVTVGSESYYLVANELISGYRLVNGNILYFGEDYRMVKNATVDGISFDGEGHIVSGINAADLDVSGLSDSAYTGSPIEPLVTVKFKGITLTRGVHYTLSYLNNTQPGEATLEVNGIGPVSGTASYGFKIIGDEAYTLTIRYVNVMGAPIAEAYTTLLEPGEKFDVPSPEVDGYKPDQENVTGTMSQSNITISVTYTKVAETSENEDTTADTSVPSTESTEPQESDPSETEDTNDKTGGYTYDYALFIKVLIIATVIAGGSIVAILNWEDIKKVIEKQKAKIKKKK